MKYIIAALLLIIQAYTAKAQSDSTLSITAYWETGDSIGWKITKREEVMENGKKTVEKTTYRAILTVLDSTETAYKIRWEEKDIICHFKQDPLIEKLLSSLPELPLIYQTDEFGKLEELKNWRYIKSEMGKAMDRFRNNFPTLPDSTARRIRASIMSEYESEEQIKFQMKDLRSFHYFYGEEIPLGKPLVRTMYFTNSYLQEYLPGEETVTVESFDEASQVAHIRSVGQLSKERLLELATKFLEKKHAILKTAPPSLEDFPVYSTTLVHDFFIDLSSGYILNGSYLRKMEFEDGYFLEEVIYELIE